MPNSGLIIIAVITMLCLAIGIILFVILYQRRIINHQIQMKELNRQMELEVMQASIRSEEEERARIAEELHDDVGATLSSIRLYLTQAARHPEDPSLIHHSKEQLDESIQKIRNLSHQLQPASLQYLGLLKALQAFAEMIERSGSIRMQFVHEELNWPEPDLETTLSVYRIIQELVNNISKHAAASWIRLSTGNSTSGPTLKLTHDGHGLTDESYQEQLYKKGAIGLKNIERRLKSSGISIGFFSETSGIYAIHLLLPSKAPDS